jgi:hypothetical protein
MFDHRPFSLENCIYHVKEDMNFCNTSQSFGFEGGKQAAVD